MLGVEVLRSGAALARLRDEWNGLCDAAPNVTPFQRPGWALAWAESLGVCSVRALALRAGRDLVALVPAFAWGTPSPRTLSLLGAGESDHLDAVCAPGFEREALDASTGWLHETRREWDDCAFDELGPSALLRALRPPPGTVASARPQSVCPVLRAASESSDLERVVPATQAARLRKARRRAERVGRVEVERADRGDAQAALRALFALHAKRWQRRGEPGAFADPRVVLLHERAAADFARRGALRLYRLRIGADTAAVVYGFRERVRLHLYMQGIDPAFERISPGLLVLGGVLADALAEDVREIDFLRGAESYKYDWGAVDEASTRVTIGPAVCQPNVVAPAKSLLPRS